MSRLLSIYLAFCGHKGIMYNAMNKYEQSSTMPDPIMFSVTFHYDQCIMIAVDFGCIRKEGALIHDFGILSGL